MITVREADVVDDALLEAFARMVPQLSSSSPPPSRAELHEMVDAPGTHVLLAEDADGRIVGTLTLVVFRIPTGVRAWIEDVVVDADAVRGKGLRTGEHLTHYALDVASKAGAKTVDLTSRPSREAANSLYQRIGFELRETNVYRYSLAT